MMICITKIKNIKVNLLILLLLVLIGSCAQQGGNEIDDHLAYGYLFAHITNDDYGSMYYSLSKDGLNWKSLNAGKRIN